MSAASRITSVAADAALASVPEQLCEQCGREAVFDRVEQEYRRCTVALASAAHEFRTPLSICSGYAALLLTEKLGSVSEAQRDVLREMDNNFRRLERFVSDFLTYASIEIKGVELHLEEADINECLSELFDIWQLRYRAKHLKLRWKPASDLKPLVFDTAKMQHAVSNLLHNAWKFTPSGGKVTLAVEPWFWERRKSAIDGSYTNRRVQQVQEPNSVRITVKDSGPGIAPEFHQDVFQEFSKLGNSDGSGLGLSITTRIADAHTGKVWLDSQPGAGCTFYIVIPLSLRSDA